MVNHIVKYSLSRIFIGFLVVIILSSFAYISTRSKYGSYTDTINDAPYLRDEYKEELIDIYSVDNVLIEGVYFWFDLITTSIPFAILDFLSFGILSDILQPRDEFGISTHYIEPAMGIVNYIGPNTLILATSVLIFVLIVTSIWIFISRKFGKNDRKNEIINGIDYQREYKMMAVIILIPIVWVIIMENFFFRNNDDSIFKFLFNTLDLPQFYSNKSLSTTFEPLLDIDLLGFDLIIMNIDWYLDRITHLIYPSLFLFLGTFSLVIIFSRIPRVTENNLPDTSFHLKYKSDKTDLKIPAILFIGFTLFVVLVFSNIVQTTLFWPGIVRNISNAEFERDWSIIVADKITLYRIIVWMSVLVDIIYYVFSSYRFTNKNQLEFQETN